MVEYTTEQIGNMRTGLELFKGVLEEVEAGADPGLYPPEKLKGLTFERMYGWVGSKRKESQNGSTDSLSPLADLLNSVYGQFKSNEQVLKIGSPEESGVEEKTKDPEDNKGDMKNFLEGALGLE